ncbi:MAG: hypothetical protein ACM3US_00585 [Sphingomonadaceae bacterium]
MDWVVRNWLIVAGVLLTLTALAGIAEGGAFHPVVAALLTVGWWGVAILALGDGLCRLVGRSCFLGSGRGLNRLLAVAQVFLSLLLLANLLSVFL